MAGDTRSDSRQNFDASGPEFAMQRLLEPLSPKSLVYPFRARLFFLANLNQIADGSFPSADQTINVRGIQKRHVVDVHSLRHETDVSGRPD
jgi:hypothetical protein